MGWCAHQIDCNPFENICKIKIIYSVCSLPKCPYQITDLKEIKPGLTLPSKEFGECYQYKPFEGETK